MTTPVIDLVTFKAAKGTLEAEIRQAAETTGAFLRGCPGFLSRQLSHDPATDTWADVVSWTDRASAERAAAASRTLPEAHALTHLAAISALTTLHLDPVMTA